MAQFSATFDPARVNRSHSILHDTLLGGGLSTSDTTPQIDVFYSGGQQETCVLGRIYTGEGIGDYAVLRHESITALRI